MNISSTAGENLAEESGMEGVKWTACTKRWCPNERVYILEVHL